MTTTVADTRTPAPRNVPSDPPVFTSLEIGMFVTGAFIIIVLIVAVVCVCVHVKKRRKSMKLPDAKYDAARESVVIEPQSFAVRTASVSSTGSAAAFMRQRSIRGRLESRLTQVRIGHDYLNSSRIINSEVLWIKG